MWFLYRSKDALKCMRVMLSPQSHRLWVRANSSWTRTWDQSQQLPITECESLSTCYLASASAVQHKAACHLLQRPVTGCLATHCGPHKHKAVPNKFDLIQLDALGKKAVHCLQACCSSTPADDMKLFLSCDAMYLVYQIVNSHEYHRMSMTCSCIVSGRPHPP